MSFNFVDLVSSFFSLSSCVSFSPLSHACHPSFVSKIILLQKQKQKRTFYKWQDIKKKAPNFLKHSRVFDVKFRYFFQNQVFSQGRELFWYFNSNVHSIWLSSKLINFKLKLQMLGNLQSPTFRVLKLCKLILSFSDIFIKKPPAPISFFFPYIRVIFILVCQKILKKKVVKTTTPLIEFHPTPFSSLYPFPPLGKQKKRCWRRNYERDKTKKDLKVMGTSYFFHKLRN